MSYIVLARKYRPQIFDELVGQEPITALLKKAVQSDRLTHAYLFCGPRGIGKTSCARILAKSLNCEKGPTLKPCGACPACLEIAKGTSFDVLEIDGASNRGIDEVRALRENVKFAPGYGRYKIYIVDEVHMLTTEAFNALLKTLEEPPEHVKFIFATTAPHKLPATITSRCQRFDFKRIPVKTIVDLLTAVSKKEKFKIDQDALYAVAKSAEGSLRDALSILDQISASDESGIGCGDVFSMLGLVETQMLFKLADALGQKNCSLCLEILDEIIDKGKDIRQLSRDITEHFRHLMIIKVGGKALGRLVDYPVAVKEMLLAQCRQFALGEILEAIDTLIGAQETARITESVRMPLEVAFAKLTYRGETPGAGEDAPGDEKTQPGISEGGQTSGGGDAINDNVPEGREEARTVQEDAVDDMETLAVEDPARVEEMETAALDLHKIKKAWDALTHGVSRERMSAATYLQEGVPYELTGRTLTIGFPPACRFQKEALEDKPNVELVERIFSEKLKAPVSVQYAIVEEYEPREEAEDVKKALDTFQGKVIHRWHE